VTKTIVIGIAVFVVALIAAAGFGTMLRKAPQEAASRGDAPVAQEELSDAGGPFGRPPVLETAAEQGRFPAGKPDEARFGPVETYRDPVEPHPDPVEPHPDAAVAHPDPAERHPDHIEMHPDAARPHPDRAEADPARGAGRKDHADQRTDAVVMAADPSDPPATAGISAPTGSVEAEAAATATMVKPQYRQFAKIMASMKASQAAEIMAYLSDEQAEMILRALGVRQVAGLLAAMPVERAAILSKRLLDHPTEEE
jgi:hypothetical protein